MEQKYIKNIAHETVLSLTDQVQIMEGQIVSKTLAQNKAVSITLFAFDKGEEIGTHDSTGDALVTILEGRGRYIVGGRETTLQEGESFVMPANIPHSVHADEAFKMLLVVVFPQEK